MGATGVVGGDPHKLGLTGGTLTGPLILPDGSPAASEQYVADHGGGGTGTPGPANVLTIGTVTTGAPGTSADATITGTSPAQVLDLTIPRGDTGAQGPKGDTGATGPAGSPATAGVSREAALLGLVAVTMPYTAPSVTDGFAVSAGTMVAMLWRPGAVTVTNLGTWLTVAGAGASGVNGMALYDAAGTLIDQTADMSTILAGSAPAYVEAALGQAQTLAADTNYYVALLTHFDTSPKVAGVLLSTNSPPFKVTSPSVAMSGQSDFPASFDPNTATRNNGAYFMAAS